MPTPSDVSSINPLTEAVLKCHVVFEIASALPARGGRLALTIGSENPDATPGDLLRVLLAGKTCLSGVVGVTAKEGGDLDIPVRLLFSNEQT